MTLQKILKEQEEELEMKFTLLITEIPFCDKEIIRGVFKRYNAKIIKAVTEEMTGKLLNPYKEEIQGYNDRVQEEVEKAKELNETKI